MNGFILAILLTLLPLVELRGGLPLALINAPKENIPTFLAFAIIILLNIILIFFIFFFLDHLHLWFMHFRFYKKFYNLSLRKMQKKISRFENAHNDVGILALFLFVAVPLPFTGAYSGTFLSWILNLERKKSILAISLGILFAGIILLLGTLGFLSLKN